MEQVSNDATLLDVCKATIAKAKKEIEVADVCFVTNVNNEGQYPRYYCQVCATGANIICAALKELTVLPGDKVLVIFCTNDPRPNINDNDKITKVDSNIHKIDYGIIIGGIL